MRFRCVVIVCLIFAEHDYVMCFGICFTSVQLRFRGQTETFTSTAQQDQAYGWAPCQEFSIVFSKKIHLPLKFKYYYVYSEIQIELLLKCARFPSKREITYLNWGLRSCSACKLHHQVTHQRRPIVYSYAHFLSLIQQSRWWQSLVLPGFRTTISHNVGKESCIQTIDSLLGLLEGTGRRTIIVWHLIEVGAFRTMRKCICVWILLVSKSKCARKWPASGNNNFSMWVLQSQSIRT